MEKGEQVTNIMDREKCSHAIIFKSNMLMEDSEGLGRKKDSGGAISSQIPSKSPNLDFRQWR